MGPASQPHVAADPGGPPATFAVDRMLGRLARWLRVLGHDVAYGPHLRGRSLLRLARAEHRWVLTRDTRLRRETPLPPLVFIASDHLREQLQQVAAAVSLDGRDFLRRCLLCNRLVEPIARDQARARVPDYVWQTQATFHACPRCGRLYWSATHRTRMRAELEALGLGGLVEQDR
ncbi:MAG: Mut7-C RNAse domain-containing protein [bacterium]|nr:Mut7-C RNAse domain-containing protein [bacterium]